MAQLTNSSVQQLLQVLDRTRRNVTHFVPLPNAYHDAVREVAAQYNVTYQTIGDLCRRRLALAAIDEFLDLLRKWLGGNAQPLQKRIKKQCDIGGGILVDQFFRDFNDGNAEVEPETRAAKPLPASTPVTVDGKPGRKLQLNISPQLAQRLHLAQMAGFGTSIEEVALTLIERGFDSEKGSIKASVDAAFAT